MKRSLGILPVFLLVGLLLSGCTGATPAGTPAGKATAVQVAPKPEWEKKWETILAEARKEGTVSIYATYVPDTRVLLTRGLRERYGLDLELTPFSLGAEIFAKVQAEQRAGLNMADAFGIGTGSLIGTMKPAGLLGPLEPMLILPEVTDPKMWRGSELPFLDKDRFVMEFIAALQRYIVYNTGVIKEGEISTYKDLLKPQYKGKITMSDPTVTGVGNSMFSHLANDLWNLEEASDFLRQLVAQQQVEIVRDRRFHVELVSRGKYPIGLAASADALAEFIDLGAPLATVSLKEGYKTSSGGGAIGVPLRPAHPNATIVFINWLLTRDGQSAFVKGFRSPSFRLDVPTEGVSPIFIPKPGEKIFRESENDTLMRPRLLEVARKVIEEARRQN